jgi:hypothetical protein
VGKLLAEYIAQQWTQLEGTFERLAIGSPRQFYDDSFFLIGDKLLDTTLLDVLAGNKGLMPPASARPIPENEEARYYFWMIEGEHDQSGKYGQRSTPPPWKDWELLTFGKKMVDSKLNEVRSDLERITIEAAARSGVKTAHDLAGEMNIPLFDCDFMRLWLQVIRPRAETLVTI